MRENQLLDPERVTVGQLLALKTGDVPVLVTTTAGATVRQALRLMALHDVSQLPVLDGTRCVGAVHEHFLSTRALEDPRLLDTTVGDVMDGPIPVVEPDSPVDRVTKLLSKVNPAVLIGDGTALRGILTRSDVLHYLMSR
jgi:cystathionine beta-synthase